MRELLLDRVLRMTKERPSEEAFVQDDRRTTYEELGEQIRRAGATLGPGTDDGERVAVLMDNSPEYVAALYGAWLSGRSVVGLNTALKAPEILRLVSHSCATCLVADPGHPEYSRVRGGLPSEVRVLEVRPGDGHTPVSGTLASPGPNPGSLAALVYTSGTTGHPKGVMLSHRNLAANTASISDVLPIVPEDRALCILPFQYSYGASILHTHLAAGATLILERSFLYPHQVLARAASERATSFAGVPSTFYLLLQRTDLGSFDLSSLRYVTQAGARMDPEKIREFRSQVPQAEFVVMYGQTEASARLAVVPPEELERKLGSAGRAIPGVDLQVRGESGDVLPPGEDGEVWARGENVMLGYWRDAEETEQVLRDGWLRTGDTGHLDADGFLFLKGRSREMIKSGGYRISPGEVEEVIRGVPGVADVAVQGIEDDVLGQGVKAWVIPVAVEGDLKRRILKVCHECLAGFKIPQEVDFTDEFPRTSSGKIRKHLL